MPIAVGNLLWEEFDGLVDALVHCLSELDEPILLIAASDLAMAGTLTPEERAALVAGGVVAAAREEGGAGFAPRASTNAAAYEGVPTAGGGAAVAGGAHRQDAPPAWGKNPPARPREMKVAAGGRNP